MTKTRLIALTSAIALFAGCELDRVRTVFDGYGTPVSGLVRSGESVYPYRSSYVAEATSVAGGSGFARLQTDGGLYSNGTYGTYPGDTSRVCGMAATYYRTVVAEDHGSYTLLRMNSRGSDTWTNKYVGADCLGFSAAEDHMFTDSFLVSSDGVRRFSQYGSQLEHLPFEMPENVYMAHAGEEDGRIAVVAAFELAESVFVSTPTTTTSSGSSYTAPQTTQLSFNYWDFTVTEFPYEIAVGQLGSDDVYWGTPDLFEHAPTRFHERDGMLYVGDEDGNVFEYDVIAPVYYWPTYYIW